MDNLQNKTYLITGANSGIGRCLTEELIKRGCHLYLVGRRIDKIQDFIRENPRVGGGVF